MSPGTNAEERLRITSAGDIFPGADNTRPGSSAKRFANIYTGDLNLSNEGSANDVDGTWGQYTIQEGEDDLFLINRRTGKKYKVQSYGGKLMSPIIVGGRTLFVLYLRNQQVSQPLLDRSIMIQLITKKVYSSTGWENANTASAAPAISTIADLKWQASWTVFPKW